MAFGRISCIAFLFLACLAGGCTQFDKTPARYPGLTGQQTGVMVYAIRPVKIDFANIQLDIAKGLQSKLIEAQKEMPELKGTTFPFRPEEIIHYQLNNPQIDAMPITKVAPKVGDVQRLIYIEVREMQTRSDVSAVLFYGKIEASLRVVEVQGDQATIGYEEPSIVAIFPPGVKEPGLPGGDDFQIYRGTLDTFTTDVATRFFAHYRN